MLNQRQPIIRTLRGTIASTPCLHIPPVRHALLEPLVTQTLSENVSELLPADAIAPPSSCVLHP